MLKVVQRPLAKKDLIKIWQYIGQHNPSAADKLLDKIDEGIQALAHHPSIGRPRPEIGNEIRSFPVDNHTIYYLHDDTKLDIIRVLHTRMDGLRHV